MVSYNFSLTETEASAMEDCLQSIMEDYEEEIEVLGNTNAENVAWLSDRKTFIEGILNKIKGSSCVRCNAS